MRRGLFRLLLLHNLCEAAYDIYTDEDIGVVEYLLAQKKAGRIRHLGFSAHGRAETIDKFLNWKDSFEFVQIQLNYLDWTLQDAERKYEVIANHGIPVIVMEPCRDGRLASLNEKADAMLKKARPSDVDVHRLSARASNIGRQGAFGLLCLPQKTRG
jgi:predicted aldo/keto reductase-like oxidoreductase